MRYDDYRQLKLELEHIQEDLEPIFIKVFLQVFLHKNSFGFFRANAKFCQEIKDQYNYKIRKMLDNYALDDIQIHKKFDEIWVSVWSAQKDFSMLDILLYIISRGAFEAKVMVQGSIKEYFKQTKTYCLEKAFEKVDDVDSDNNQL